MNKTWFIDIDGTIFKHRNNQQIDVSQEKGEHEEELLPGVKEFFKSIPENDEPKDDRRLSVEVSAVQALNEDIVNIFATLDAFDNAIGDPELVFAREYRDIRNLRKIYFNRLEDKVSLTKFFQFFKSSFIIFYFTILIIFYRHSL